MFGIIPLAFQYCFVDCLTALAKPKAAAFCSLFRKALIISTTFILPIFMGAMGCALYARTYGNHTINNANSSRTRLENITINTSSAMAILNNSAERPFVVNCKVEALPGSFVSTSADGIYMRNISLGGLVKGNGIRHVGDDFMNIHSYVHPAAKTDGKTIYVNSSDWDPRTLAAGRRLGLIRASAGETVRTLPACDRR